MEKALKKYKIKFKKQVPLCGISVVDFYIPKTKTIIQCDGDYWHRRPEAKQRDELQNKIFWEKGYNLYRFWEKDIIKSAKSCIDKIDSILLFPKHYD